MTAPSRSRRNVLFRALLTAVAVVVLMPGALVLAGAFLPGVPYIDRGGAFLTIWLGWVWISVLGGLLLTGLAVALGGRRGTLVLLAICLVFTAGAGVATARLLVFAREYGASFSLLRQLRAPAAEPVADAHVVYATVPDGQVLHAGIWRAPADAPNAGEGGRAALVYVHGGGFVGGWLDMRPHLFKAMANAGYPVIDVEYRLTPPPRWDQAPGDVLCALAWLPTVAADYGIDPNRVVLMGDSAGASLAMLAGYGAGTDLVPSTCPGVPVLPAGLILIGPAADLAGMWQDATLSIDDRPFPESYIGGPPSQYPDRYELASPFRLIREGLPPTLVITGENDHIVRLPRIHSLVDPLLAAGVDTRLLVVPYADHGFDGLPDGFGAQLEESLLPAFMAEVTR